jgi:hypothetical protein
MFGVWQNIAKKHILFYNNVNSYVALCKIWLFLGFLCIIVWDLSVENVSELNCIHIHAQCGNWCAGISYPYSRACPLIGSFLLGFTYCDGRERECDRNIIFRCSFIDYFFLGFHTVTTGNVFLCLSMIQNRKNIKTLGNLINTKGLRPLVQIR